MQQFVKSLILKKESRRARLRSRKMLKIVLARVGIMSVYVYLYQKIGLGAKAGFKNHV